MTTPTLTKAFSCPCITEARDIENGGGQWAPWCTVPGNHFDRFWKSHASHGGLIPSRFAFVIEEHYEAHFRGAPHSHLRKLAGDSLPLRLIWDRVSCACHHVEQNFTVAPGEMVRGFGWAEA